MADMGVVGLPLQPVVSDNRIHPRPRAALPSARGMRGDVASRPSCRRCFSVMPARKSPSLLSGAWSLAGTDCVALFIVSLDSALESWLKAD